MQAFSLSPRCCPQPRWHSKAGFLHGYKVADSHRQQQDGCLSPWSNPTEKEKSLPPAIKCKCFPSIWLGQPGTCACPKTHNNLPAPESRRMPRTNWLLRTIWGKMDALLMEPTRDLEGQKISNAEDRSERVQLFPPNTTTFFSFYLQQLLKMSHVNTPYPFWMCSCISSCWH